MSDALFKTYLPTSIERIYDQLDSLDFNRGYHENYLKIFEKLKNAMKTEMYKVLEVLNNPVPKQKFSINGVFPRYTVSRLRKGSKLFQVSLIKFDHINSLFVNLTYYFRASCL